MLLAHSAPMDRDDEWFERWAKRSNSEVAAAWIDYQSRDHARDEAPGDDHAWWAVEALMCLSDDDPRRALEICFGVAKTTRNPTVLAMLGAGPLEDLLSEDPSPFDAVQHETGVSPALVEALRHVAQSTIPDDVWRRMQQVVCSP